MIPAALLASPLLKIAAILTTCAALFSGGLYLGYQWGSKELPKAQVEQQINFTKTLQERWGITDGLAVVYMDRVQKVRSEARVIIQEVPKYVQDTCTLSPGVRLLHDAAAQGQLPASE